jgi:hypothetical protein
MKIQPNEMLIENFVDHPVHEDHQKPHLAPFLKHGHLKEFDILVSKSKQVSNIDMFTLALSVAA